MIEGLEKLLAQGRDSAELRFGLGNAYLGQKAYARAIVHLKACLDQKPDYSAAWKLLGRAYQAEGQLQEAIDTYVRGIAVARKTGDKQAEKEMAVFLKRLQQAGP